MNIPFYRYDIRAISLSYENWTFTRILAKMDCTSHNDNRYMKRSLTNFNAHKRLCVHLRCVQFRYRVATNFRVVGHSLSLSIIPDSSCSLVFFPAFYVSFSFLLFLPHNLLQSVLIWLSYFAVKHTVKLSRYAFVYALIFRSMMSLFVWLYLIFNFQVSLWPFF